MVRYEPDQIGCGNSSCQVKLEIQFLPQPDALLQEKAEWPKFFHLEILEGRQLRSVQRGDQKQDPFVQFKYLDQMYQVSRIPLLQYEQVVNAKDKTSC